MSAKCELSTPGDIFLVIPSYREGTRLAHFLPGLLETLAFSLPEVRVLVVDDGSGQEHAAATFALVESLRPAHPNLAEPLLLPENLGKGGAIYAGWKQAGGAEWLAFADADGATPAAEIVRLLQAAREPGCSVDLWLASRIKMLGRRVERTLRRHLFGRIYATLASELTGLPVYDSQCGCKAVRADAYQIVSPRLQEQRFGFDIELLWHVHREGFVLREFPVDWVDVPGSKVHLLRDSWRMFCSLLRLWREVQAAGGRKPLQRPEN